MSSSNESTRANTLAGATTPQEKELSEKRSTAHQSVDLDFFDKVGSNELSRRLSRTQSSLTNASFHTQDPISDDFDYKQHLRAVLRRGEKEGIINRELGVSFEGLRVTGEGNGLAYGPSMGEIGYGITHMFAKKLVVAFFVRISSFADIALSELPHQRLFSLISLDPSSRRRCSSFLEGW